MRRVALIALAVAVSASAVDAAQPDRGARVAVDSSRESGHADHRAHEGKQAAEQQPAPAQVAKHQEDAARNAQAAKAAQEREEANLKAQVRIADAAERQQVIAWWQALYSAVGIGITALGTAYLVLTFRETRRTAQAGVDAAGASARSAEAAEAALALSQASTRMQLRPNVAYASGRLTGGTSAADWNTVELQVQNFGATVA